MNKRTNCNSRFNKDQAIRDRHAANERLEFARLVKKYVEGGMDPITAKSSAKKVFKMRKIIKESKKNNKK